MIHDTSGIVFWLLEKNNQSFPQQSEGKNLTVSKERNEDPKRNENILSASDERKKKHVSLHDKRLKSVLFPPSLAGIQKKHPIFLPNVKFRRTPSSPKKIDQKERNEIAKPQQNQLLLFVQERSKFQIQKEWNWNSPVPKNKKTFPRSLHITTAAAKQHVVPLQYYRAHIYFLRSIRFGWVNNKDVWKDKAGREMSGGGIWLFIASYNHMGKRRRLSGLEKEAKPGLWTEGSCLEGNKRIARS